MECNVCLEPFNAQQRRPKSLPCGHTICQRCLQGLSQRQCPEDRKVFPAGALPDNYMVLQLLDNPPSKSAPRFWCSDCKKEATAACVEEHTVCAMKKAHAERAQPHLEALQVGVAALAGLRAQLDAVEAEAAACRVAIEGKKAKLEAARRALEAAPGAEQAVFERAIAASSAILAGATDVPLDTVRLLDALADPATTLHVALDAPRGAWRGRVRPREDAASRLLLCRLLCGDHLVRAPDDHGQETAAAAAAAAPRGARRQLRRQDREGVPQQEEPQQQQQQQQQQYAQNVVVPTLAPRWQERKNGSNFEDASDVKGTVGHARVVDLKSWQGGGEVTAYQGLTLAPRGSDTHNASLNLYGKPKYEQDTLVIRQQHGGVWSDTPYDITKHKVLSCFNQIGGPAGTFKQTAHTHLCTRGISSGPNVKARSKLLDDPRLYQVRELIGLRCDTSPAWAGLLMEKVALHLEVLQLMSPHAEHLRVAAAMPRLHSLHLDRVDTEMLRLALSVPSLRRLEVHCSWEQPLVVLNLLGGEVLRLPRAPALVWLRLGVYPLAAALAVARAHAATLRELELVAASDLPYGCPDLGRELAACGLALLQKLVLQRDSPHEVCRHDAESCSMQKVQLWDMLHYRCKQEVEILCSFCDRATRTGLCRLQMHSSQAVRRA